MKKKAVALLTIPALAFGVLAGCGKPEEKTSGTASSGDAKDKEVSLTVQAEKTWVPYYEKVKETIEKEYPKATITIKESGSFDMLDVLDKTDVTNKDVADVFALPVDRLYGLAKNNALAAIDAEKMADEVGGFKDFKNGLGGNLKVNNEYLAFPYNIETLIGFVNVENAKKDGIDYTKPVEFNSVKYNQLLATVNDAWIGVAFTNTAGLDLLGHDADGKLVSDLTKDYSELSADQQKVFEGLYNYWKANYDAKTALWDKDAMHGYVDSEFKTGGTDAIKIDGPWATPSVKELVGSAENLEIIPLSNITFNGKPLTHWKGGWALGINARVEENAAQMEVAEAFIKEMVNPKNAKELFQATGKVLENATAADYEGIDTLDKKVIDATYSSYEQAVARPLFSEWGQVWSSWQNALLSWSSTKPANAEAAYKEVQASFKSMMANFK